VRFEPITIINSFLFALRGGYRRISPHHQSAIWSFNWKFSFRRTKNRLLLFAF